MISLLSKCCEYFLKHLGGICPGIKVERTVLGSLPLSASIPCSRSCHAHDFHLGGFPGKSQPDPCVCGSTPAGKPCVVGTVSIHSSCGKQTGRVRCIPLTPVSQQLGSFRSCYLAFPCEEDLEGRHQEWLHCSMGVILGRG